MNPTLLQSFHFYTEGNGIFYKKIAEMAPWLRETGITGVWLPPAYKAAGGGYSVGYDPYDIYDLGEFDQKGTTATKYGTKKEYLEAVKSLQKEGISVMVDVVLNHKAGGDELEKFHVVRVEEDNRLSTISEPFEIQSYTKFNFDGRGEKYSAFKWDFTCFTGVDYAEGQDKGVFRILTDHGDGWDELIDSEKGNYDFLMYNDIEHRNPYVRAELNKWGQWYHELLNFDSVRLDAVKHISPDFYKEWLYMLRQNTGKEIFAVGEYWAPGYLLLLEKYIDATDGCMSLFDSSLQHNLHMASLSGDYDLRNIFKETLVATRPDKAVTVVDNHDTQPLQSLEAPVEEWFKPIAYALILLRHGGIPCVFAPDLFGAHYTDHGNDGNEHEIFLNKIDGLEQMIGARQQYAFGEQKDYFDDAHCIGWVRTGDAEHLGCAVSISNKDANVKSMEMGTLYAGQTFVDMLGSVSDEITIAENGWADFPAPAGNVSIWVPKSDK